jgi:hypothetical protein
MDQVQFLLSTHVMNGRKEFRFQSGSSLKTRTVPVLAKIPSCVFPFDCQKPASEECTMHNNEEKGEQRWLKANRIFSLSFITLCFHFKPHSKPGGLSLMICSAVLEFGIILPELRFRDPVLCTNLQNWRLMRMWLVQGRTRKWEWVGRERDDSFAWLLVELRKVDNKYSAGSLSTLGSKYRATQKWRGAKWTYLCSPLRFYGDFLKPTSF